MTDGEYDALLRAFYSAYDFEVASEGGYAHFDTDIVNKLIFDSANLEGKGKREILVKVSAKYPKYEGNRQFTEATVTIKAVFGVQVNNMKELRMACQLQKDYALREDNVVPERMASLLDIIDVKETMFNVITKSGAKEVHMLSSAPPKA